MKKVIFDRDVLFRLGKGLLTHEGLNGIGWPDPSIQRAYTGADGEVLLQRTIDFVEKLIACAPIIECENWRGLDYGVGFGRIASILSNFGRPDQLTCVDAWEKSLSLAKSCGLKNPAYLVDSQLGKLSLQPNSFDFAYAYSIFTHLPKDVFLKNIEMIVSSLKPGGVFVFTVREPKFLEFLMRNNKYNPVVNDLLDSGYWFGNQQNESYGDTVFDIKWIESNLSCFGVIENIGIVKSEPFQLILALRPS